LIQKIINLIYRNPKSELKKFRRFGGYLNYRAMQRENAAMKKASYHLPPVQSYANGFRIYFLTGKNYLYQTLFCICSLVRYTNEEFQFLLIDDGSFDNVLIKQINGQLPGAIIITRDAIAKNIETGLPAARYPALHRKRAVYPHIKKLTDIHTIPGESWKLVLDSDMLFWGEPVEMLEWLKAPNKPLHLIDCAESYGYSALLMKELAGREIKPLINVGALGLNSKTIAWNEVDTWIRDLEAGQGASYYLEQALSAMIIGDTESIALRSDRYIVNPLGSSGGVLHHYVDLSKEQYFKFAWKQFV
jgi:hypothetical protein